MVDALKLEGWLSGIPSKHTRKCYRSGIRKFESYYQKPIESMLSLSDEECGHIIEKFYSHLKEKKEDLSVKASYLGSEIVVSSFLEEVISDLSKPKEKEVKRERTALGIEDLVGDPINFKGIVYAPMNEAGVILLFSKIMDDLGIFYESSPSKGIDMIGRRRTEKGLRRVFIEFEYNSKNFVTHKHDPRLCDILVCWEHDWKECPIEEVIVLKDIIEQYRE